MSVSYSFTNRIFDCRRDSHKKHKRHKKENYEFRIKDYKRSDGGPRSVVAVNIEKFAKKFTDAIGRRPLGYGREAPRVPPLNKIGCRFHSFSLLLNSPFDFLAF
jgi:hypothetical protein